MYHVEKLEEQSHYVDQKKSLSTTGKAKSSELLHGISHIFITNLPSFNYNSQIDRHRIINSQNNLTTFK